HVDAAVLGFGNRNIAAVLGLGKNRGPRGTSTDIEIWRWHDRMSIRINNILWHIWLVFNRRIIRRTLTCARSFSGH
ncbi:MAG TPA: hypothetical protein DD435_13715, partial [Cyanobacteria bacterium UBA8530]|nr:hypothetical protein [Cyanobacteria bacterium UBA8530]